MKIALINGASVLQVWSLPAGKTELAIRYTLPNGEQLSPVKLGYSRLGYAVVEVTEFSAPEGKQTIGAPSYAVAGGVAVESYAVEDIPSPPVLDRVTRRQFRRQLLAMPPIGSGETLLDDVDAWVATQSRDVQESYGSSGTFVRDEPMMQAGFAALGFSSAQIDAFFQAASVL